MSERDDIEDIKNLENQLKEKAIRKKNLASYKD